MFNEMQTEETVDTHSCFKNKQRQGFLEINFQNVWGGLDVGLGKLATAFK